MKIPEQFRSIRWRISGYFMMVTVLMITIMGVSLFYTLSGIISTEVAKSTSVAIDKSGHYLEIYMKQIKGLSRILAENTQVRRMFSEYSTTSQMYQTDKGDVEKLIHSVLGGNQELVSIIMVGRDGRIVTNEKQLTMDTSKNMMDEPWYKGALGQGSMPTLTSARMQDFSMDKDNWVISLSQEIQGESGEHLGVLRIDFRYDVIEKNLSGLDLGVNGFSFIINDHGEVVYHKDTGYFENDEKRKDLIHILQMPMDKLADQLKLVHSYHLENTDWLLVGVASLDSIVRMEHAMIQLMWILGFGMLVAFLWITFFFLGRVTEPIRKLQKAMDQVEENMLEIEVLAVGGLEVENLGRHFNKMMARIRLLLHEVTEKEKYLRTYELRALHSQINPHFLYNTLDTIVWMAEFKDSEKVVAITKALAKFFRLSLTGGADTTTVGNEIDHVRQYLFIQKERYEDKLTYEIHADETILQMEIPKIILQPIVENAIYHGIRPLDGSGKISIFACQRKDDLVFTVKDNGVGFDTAKLAEEGKKENSHLGSIGIKNVDDRLRLYYGHGYGVSIKSQQGEGTEVTLVARTTVLSSSPLDSINRK